MQMTKNGIPIDIPGLRRNSVKAQIVQNQANDYNAYYKFATMRGVEEGCIVTAVVPLAHPEYRIMKKQGYKVLEVWDKRNVKGETA